MDSDFTSGVALIHLLESLSNKKAPRYEHRPESVHQKIDNVNIALQFMRRDMNIPVVGSNPQGTSPEICHRLRLEADRPSQIS